MMAKANNVKNSSPSEYVIGRMEHICHESFNLSKIQQKKYRKGKHNAKFLSMIVEGE